MASRPPLTKVERLCFDSSNDKKEKLKSSSPSTLLTSAHSIKQAPWMSKVVIHQLLMLFRNYKQDSGRDSNDQTCVLL